MHSYSKYHIGMQEEDRYYQLTTHTDNIGWSNLWVHKIEHFY